ncbi:hypothetical protein WNZ15_13070 [Roseibium sp. AS2]|uniref:hypothetical protein n=1 Tax=Roseibium sp. AS2 TaxID=3135781 RepID=UPI0031748629
MKLHHLEVARSGSFSSIGAYLARARPDEPVMFYAADVLRAKVFQFQKTFAEGLSYAIKANNHPNVLGHVLDCGVCSFDVASPAEIGQVRRKAPGAVLHYNNPVRSPAEIETALRAGVSSFSVDRPSELEKLFALVPPGAATISLRFKHENPSSAYGFGAKFGATIADAERLLQSASRRGYRTGLNFHVGTQCNDPKAWADHLGIAAAITRNTGTVPAEINVGGGFPSWRTTEEPRLGDILRIIGAEFRAHFDPGRVRLLCEPGRALIADAVTLATRIKARSPADTLYLNDGIYGRLNEFPLVGLAGRTEILTPAGERRQGTAGLFRVFGPTCDSVDKLPEPVALPEDCREGDYLLFHGMGAYSNASATDFNGYGGHDWVAVDRLLPPAGSGPSEIDAV